MKYQVSMPGNKKTTIMYVGRKGEAYVEIRDGLEIELTDAEFACALSECSGGFSLKTAGVVKEPVKAKGKDEK
jgi:hypothetical protein